MILDPTLLFDEHVPHKLLIPDNPVFSKKTETRNTSKEKEKAISSLQALGKFKLTVYSYNL